jgi:hypothetical protein
MHIARNRGSRNRGVRGGVMRVTLRVGAGGERL